MDELVRRHLDALGFGPGDILRRREQTEAAQFARWGRTGLDLLSIEEDAEETQHRGAWSEAEVDDVLAFIDAL